MEKSKVDTTMLYKRTFIVIYMFTFIFYKCVCVCVLITPTGYSSFVGFRRQLSRTDMCFAFTMHVLVTKLRYSGLATLATLNHLGKPQTHVFSENKTKNKKTK